MSKRTRSSTPWRAGSKEIDCAIECAVCLDTIVYHMFPFNCGHPICDKCDTELFARADDRCPTCRQPRLQDSIEQRVGSRIPPNILQRRSDAIAQRNHEQSVRAIPVLFFPVEGLIEVHTSNFFTVDENSEDEQLPDQRHRRHRPHRPHRPQQPDSRDEHNVQSGVILDGRVRAAIGALINASEMSMAEFSAAMGALRATTPPHAHMEFPPPSTHNPTHQLLARFLG